MAEPVMFQEGMVQITRRAVVVEGQRYALDDVSSVQIETVGLPRGAVPVAVVLAIACLLVSQLNGSTVLLAVGVIVLALIGFLLWRANRTYILVLGTSKGDQQVWTSRDRQVIDRAAQAIDALIVARNRR